MSWYGRTRQRLSLSRIATLGDRRAPGLLKGLPEKDERLGAGLFRSQVVSLVVVDRVDLLQLDEVGDTDRVDGLHRQVIEVLLGDGNVVALGVLESTYDVVPRDGLFVFRAPADVL